MFLKIINAKFIIFVLFMLNGCCFSSASYENFAYKRDIEMQYVVSDYNRYRSVYDENKYIYKFSSYKDPRCIYAFFTNRDDKPEKVIEWKVLSGKEYCKETFVCR
ncbi:hypothetical protein [Campylobacter mucosalis]|uniref:Lipoprotein n=1 Tax=Campylobacter mucosalis CCUG 21559 TaxID=1032067 RepID=A0A6G5QJ72_9BACT|nr:hypothetical protein [Campylobacter mucosalis]QCD45669.1 hypothetical protein CMUC_1928 [Campylobacter mucosalis CCUG 21559]